MRAFILAFLLSAAVHAQDRFQVSRTEWSDPDFTGTWLTVNTVGLSFQRPADDGDDSLLRELVNAGAVEFGLINEGVPAAPREAERRWAVTEWRGSHFNWGALVVDPQDGRLPPLLPGAVDRAATTGAVPLRPPGLGRAADPTGRGDARLPGHGR